MSQDSTKDSNEGITSSKPRGFYTHQPKWTKDETKDYFEGLMNQFGWPIIKIYGILIVGQVIHAIFQRTWLTVVLCMLVINFYPVIVARCVENTIEMAPLDHQCFISTPGVHVNYMNESKYDNWDENILKESFKEVFTFMPKFRYKLKEIAGDYYYENMPMEELIEKFFIGPESEDKVLRSQDDINQYIADNINKKMPMDGPQARIYLQKYDPIDMDHIEESKRPKGIMIWKCHHSFCDGVSSGSLILALSNAYDRSYFLASKDARWYMRLLARVMTVFQIPKIAIQQALTVGDKNYFSQKKSDIQQLSGVMNCSSSKVEIDVQQIKDLSKYKGVTINDVFICSMTTAFHKIFSEQDGPKVESIKMALPANLRFKFYKTRKHVKLENKFACLPIEVPLSPTMEQSYGKIVSATKSLKNSMGALYASYAMSHWCNKLFPRFVCRQVVYEMSSKFTLAFSNTPGAIKQITYENTKTGELMRMMTSRSYLMVAGNMGMGMCIFSQTGKVCTSFTSDESVCDREMNKRIMDMTIQNILDEIDKMQQEKMKDQNGGAAVPAEQPQENQKCPLT